MQPPYHCDYFVLKTKESSVPPDVFQTMTSWRMVLEKRKHKLFHNSKIVKDFNWNHQNYGAISVVFRGSRYSTNYAEGHKYDLCIGVLEHELGSHSELFKESFRENLLCSWAQECWKIIIGKPYNFGNLVISLIKILLRTPENTLPMHWRYTVNTPIFASPNILVFGGNSMNWNRKYHNRVHPFSVCPANRDQVSSHVTQSILNHRVN